jgi:hypothetical protein
MSQEPELTLPGDGEVSRETIQKDFIDYLDSKVAPLFVAESLSLIFRHEPPVYFTAKEIADLVATWARVRAPMLGGYIHEYYLKSIEMIATAERTGMLAGFKPSAFYMPFFEGLVRNCPPEEKELFRPRLKQLRDEIFKEWDLESRGVGVEFEITETVAGSFQEKQQAQDRFGDIIDAIRAQGLRWSANDQQMVMAELRSVIEKLLIDFGFIITPYLEALIDVAIYIFNAGQLLFGSELLYIVQQVYNWGGMDPAGREALRRFRSASALDETQMKLLLGKPELRGALQVFFDHFDELSPYNLLNDLAQESDRQKRRYLISLIEAHANNATPVIVRLLAQAKAEDSWHMARNFIYLLGRVPPASEAEQRAATRLIIPYLRSPIPQLRIAALAAMESFPFPELLDSLRHFFDDKQYTAEELNNQERISTYLNGAINIISKINSEPAMRLLAEIAVGRHIDFISEKLARALRMQSMKALAARRDVLNAPLLSPILERIRALTSRWKKLMSRLLGEDEQELMALLEIIAGCPIPPVIELLKDISARYADQPSGGRAAEILTQLEEGR